MKKNILLILIVMFISVYFLTAQDPGEPCKPDCENSHWTPQYPDPAPVLTIELCGKLFEVRYRYRIACGIWYDYYIELVAAGQNTSTGDMLNCIEQYGGIENFLRAASEILMIHNPANFPPNGEGCATNWRVMKGSCWMKAYVVGAGGGLLQHPLGYSYYCFIEPCTPNDCCLEYYTVCIQNGVRIITQTGYLPPQNQNCQYPCEPVCGSIYNR